MKGASIARSLPSYGNVAVRILLERLPLNSRGVEDKPWKFWTY